MKATRRSEAAKLGLILAGAAAIGMPLAVQAINSVAPTVSRVSQDASPGQNAPAAIFSAGVADILKMVDAKVDAEVVKAYIQNSPIAYSPSAAEIIALKNRGVGPEILTAMLQRGAEVRAQATRLAQGAGSPAAPRAAPAVTGPYAPAYDNSTQPAYPQSTYVYPATTYVYPGYSYSYPAYYYGGYDWGYSWPWYWPSFYYGCYPYRGYYWGYPYASCGYRYSHGSGGHGCGYYRGGGGYYNGRSYYGGHGYHGGNGYSGSWTRTAPYGAQGVRAGSFSGAGRPATFASSPGGFRSAGGFGARAGSFGGGGGMRSGGGFGGHSMGRGH
jgi:hypothetical protein